MAFNAEIAQTERKVHPLLIYRSTTNLDLCYKFQFLRQNNDGFSYKCFGCSEVAKSTKVIVNSLRVNKNYTRFLSDPEELNHVCRAGGFIYQYLDSTVQQIYRKIGDEAKEQGLKGSAAKAKMCDTIKIFYPNDSATAIMTLPSPKAVTKTFSNKRKHSQIDNFDPLAPPQKIFVSSLTRNNQQSLMLRTYSQVSPPFMFLSDRTNLEAIHKAPTLMFDGTFAYCPREFYRRDYTIINDTGNEEIRTTSGQVYTMHAVFTDLPECQSSFLSGIGFLSHKNEQEYDQLFAELRTSLIEEFGDVGGAKTVMFDMEPAAHKMLKRHFPEWHLRSCYFHYFKNIKTQAEKKGLHDAFKSDVFLKWFNGLMGSVFLDQETAVNAFRYLIDNPPEISQNTTSFIKYLRKFWLPKLEKVICWDTDQPRTNNPAEAYHSTLATAFKNDEHPSVGFAFNVFAGHLNDGAVKFLNAKTDSDSPMLQGRTKKACKFDQKLMAAKRKIIDFVNELSSDQSMPMDYLLHYCRHIRFLAGGFTSGAARENSDAILKFNLLPVTTSPMPVLQRPMILPRVLGVKQSNVDSQTDAQILTPRLINNPRSTNSQRTQSQKISSNVQDSDEEVDVLG